MKVILVTGIAGFLGSHIAEKCVLAGHRVIGVDNLIGGEMENVPQGAYFVEADCCDYRAMKAITKGVDIVFHCAATAYEGLSVFSPHFVTKNIYDASMSVISASISNGVQRFIFCSSMARYGTNKTPFNERMKPKPQDPYGVAKVAVEQSLKELCDVHGMEYVIAVPHNIIGQRQKYDDPYRNVAAIMINLMLQGKRPVIYGDGKQKRCFSFIDDVVEPLYACGWKGAGEIINIGPDEEETTILELYRILARILDFPHEPVFMAGRPKEVKNATCSSDKARRILGYKTTVGLEKGLQLMIDFIKDRGLRPFKYHIPLEIQNEHTPETWKSHLF